MEVGEVIQNGGLVIGGAALAKIYDTLLAWWKTRQPVEVKQPIDVTGEIGKPPKYVTVQEFNRHVEGNARDHENMFARMNANDKLTSKLEGILEGIREDLKAIKNKLFRTK